MKIALLVSYEGTSFKGWQQTSEGESIEGALKKALEHVLQHEVKLDAASRTDAGVHATGQVVHFEVSQKPKLEETKLLKGINGLLPHAIVVRGISEVSAQFHSSLSAVGKEYHYYLWIHPTMPPHLRLYLWRCFFQLDKEKMISAAKYLLGTHSFEALCNDKERTGHKSYIRRLDRLEILQPAPYLLRIEMEGNGFLYRMARNLVGLLVACGRNQIEPEQVPLILEQGERKNAGVTAPAEGLYLHRVIYREEDVPSLFLHRSSPALQRWLPLMQPW